MDLLCRAARDIVLDGATNPSITLRGGLFSEILGANTMSANSSMHCLASLQISQMPDLTITLPKPVAVPIVDRRRKLA